LSLFNNKLQKVQKAMLADDVQTEFNKIGDLSALTTSDKSNLVNAIKENTTQLAENAKVWINVLYPPTPLTGAMGDGTTDDTAAINAILSAYKGQTIYFPKPTAHYYIKGTITIPYTENGTRLLFAGGNNIDSGGLVQIDDSFPATQDIFNVANGTIIDGLTVCHKGTTKFTGIGLNLGNGGSNVQHCRITNCRFLEINIGIRYGGQAYYNTFDHVAFYHCNVGIEFNSTGSSFGSLKVAKGHFAQMTQHAVSVLSNCNQVEIDNCTFEHNNHHVYSTSGTVSFIKCYMGDGAADCVYVDGGTVLIDGHYTEFVGGAGNGSFMTTDPNTPSYGIHANSGKVILRNLQLLQNAHTVDGSINGVQQQGNDIYSNTAIIDARDTQVSGYRPIRVMNNKNNLSEEINNYVINGNMADTNKLGVSPSKSGFDTISVVGDNGFGGKAVQFKDSVGGRWNSIQFYYYAPHLVGKHAYLGAFMGSVDYKSGVPVPAIYCSSGEYTLVTDGTYPMYGYTNVSGQNIMMEGTALANHVQHVAIPVLINKPFGQITYRFTNPSGAGNYINLYGLYLTDIKNGGKMVRLKDVHNFHMGTTAPTTGVWNVGEKVINATPTAGGYEGWVCTTAGDFAGTPPVFKGFGAIQA
jgi:hypothetical protein